MTKTEYIYNIIIQENQRNGNILLHTLPLDPAFVQEALKVREADNNYDCFFILEYCLN